MGCDVLAPQGSAAPPSLEDLDEDEQCFAGHLEVTISTWLATAAADGSRNSSSSDAQADGSSSSSSDTLYLPAPPPQLQKLQRRLLAAGIGSSRWRGGGSSSSSSDERLYIIQQQGPSSSAHIGSSSGSGVMLRRATAAELTAEETSHRAHRAEEVLAATGFSQVFELLRDSQKPAVGHNVRFDLAYCMAAFVQSPLPKTWAGYKDLVAQWLPGGVYDTKYLAHCLPSSGSSGGSSSRVLMDTSLGSLYSTFAEVGEIFLGHCI